MRAEVAALKLKLALEESAHTLVLDERDKLRVENDAMRAVVTCARMLSRFLDADDEVFTDDFGEQLDLEERLRVALAAFDALPKEGGG